MLNMHCKLSMIKDSLFFFFFLTRSQSSIRTYLQPSHFSLILLLLWNSHCASATYSHVHVCLAIPHWLFSFIASAHLTNKLVIKRLLAPLRHCRGLPLLLLSLQKFIRNKWATTLRFFCSFANMGVVKIIKDQLHVLNPSLTVNEYYKD